MCVLFLAPTVLLPPGPHARINIDRFFVHDCALCTCMCTVVQHGPHLAERYADKCSADRMLDITFRGSI